MRALNIFDIQLLMSFLYLISSIVRYSNEVHTGIRHLHECHKQEFESGAIESNEMVVGDGLQMVELQTIELQT